MLGVARRTIILWIEDGRLRAHKTPGGHRRIERLDLISFLQDRSMPVPGELLPREDRILIVDSDEKELAGAVRKLRSDGERDYQVQVARNGYECLLKIGRFDPSILLFEYTMTSLDAGKMLRCLRENTSFSHVMIIAMADKKGTADFDEIIEAGAHAVIAKPFSIAKLNKCLDKFRVGV